MFNFDIIKSQNIYTWDKTEPRTCWKTGWCRRGFSAHTALALPTSPHVKVKMSLLYLSVFNHPEHFKIPLTKWIRHHQGCIGNNKYCSFTQCHTIKDVLEWDLTLHRSTHHVTKESAPLLCIIMNYHLNVWVGEIFQCCLLCSHLRIFHFEGEAASATSAFYTLFTSLSIPLFALLILLQLFFFHSTPSALQR